MLVPILLPVAGVLVSVFYGETMPDSTLVWISIFCVGTLNVLATEIKQYLKDHEAAKEHMLAAREAMDTVLKRQLTEQKSQAAGPNGLTVDEAKLAEKMVDEIQGIIKKNKEKAKKG